MAKASLLIKIGCIEIKVNIDNDINNDFIMNERDVIMQPYFNHGLDNTPLALWCGWIIASD